MEINLTNAFTEAVKLSCRPCVEKYHTLMEINQKLCHEMISYLLKRPLLTTALFSIFMILCIIVLSAVFITLVGVFIIAVVILLFEGFIFLIITAVFSMIAATVTLFVMIIVGIKYKVSLLHNLD